MKKLIIKVAFAAAILFSGAMLFQVENVDAQVVAVPIDEPDLGKWIKIYEGSTKPKREDCLANAADECQIGDTRRPQRDLTATDAEPVATDNVYN